MNFELTMDAAKCSIRFLTHIGENWNQLVKALYNWKRFGKVLELEVLAHN
jgi:hypothetical protein